MSHDLIAVQDDDLGWKILFGVRIFGGRLFVEVDLRWKTTYGGRRSGEDDVWIFAYCLL